jgi:hypothetical protein
MGTKWNELAVGNLGRRWMAIGLTGLAGLAHAGEFAILGTPSGSTTNQTLAVTVTPASEDMGTTGKTFIAAMLPGGSLYFYTPAGWSAWSGGDMPAYASAPLASVSATPIDGMNVSGLEGTSILAGYGRSADDMITRRTYAVVHVLGASQPVLAGVASKGTWASPTITAYSVDTQGQRVAMLGSATADSQGAFSLRLGALTSDAVELEASGGSYQSAYDGTTKTSTATASRLLSTAATSTSGIAITPVTAMAATLAKRTLVDNAGSTAAATAISAAEQTVETIYGLGSGGADLVPRFEATAVTTAPQAAQLAMLLGGMETLGNTLYPNQPDVVTDLLARDLADGVLDGKADSTALTVSGSAVSGDLGTAQLIARTLEFSSAYVSGVLPAYVASTTVRYTSTAIPVYVSSSIPTYQAGTVATYHANAKSLTANTSGPTSIGAYSCLGGATISVSNNRYSCSDGSIAMYTSQSIQPYHAGTALPSGAAQVGAHVSDGTIPVYTSVSNIHVFTEAERAAMNAASSAIPAGWNIPQGGLNQAQVDAYGLLNHNLQVWYSGNPFRVGYF